MRLARTLVMALGLVAPPIVSAAVLDPFDTAQTISGPSGGVPRSSKLSAVPGAIGDNRSLTATGVGPDDAYSVSVGGGAVQFALTAGLQGSGDVDWDSFGNSVHVGEPFDLTAGGSLSAFRFDVLNQTVDGVASVGVESRCDGCLAVSRVDVPLTGPGTYVVPFSAFATPVFQADAPADLSAVKDFGLGFQTRYGAAPGSVTIGNFATVPEPASALTSALAAMALLGATARRASPALRDGAPSLQTGVRSTSRA